MRGNTSRGWLTPFNIALLYTVLGGAWIFFADQVMASFLREPALIGQGTLVNHWVFIVVSGQALYWVIRHRETAVERSQKSLFRTNRALRYFSECNKAITWDREESELLHKICRILVMLGGYRLAWVGFAGHDELKVVDPVAFWGYEEGYLDDLKVTWDDAPSGQGPAGTTIRTGRTTVVQHIMTNPKFSPWREKAVRHGFAAALALPLRDGKETFGALIILAGEADAFNNDEISLLEELADDLSLGITHLRREAEQARIKEEQLLLAAVIAQESEGVMTFDQDGTVQYVNPAWQSICGIPADCLVGKNLQSLDGSEHCLELYQAMQEALTGVATITGSFICQHPDGTRFQIDTRISPVRGHADKIVRYVAVIHDVTHEVLLEEQLRTAQKMEAIATLSGGIAHDFNNILAAIITNTELTMDDVPEQSAVHEHLKIVLQAGLRGRNLVRQIKTMSQQTVQEHHPVKVELVVEECLQLLRASLPTTIEIRQQITPELGQVLADSTQLHQVILNLCTNATEAMAHGDGILEVRLEPFYHLAPYEQSYPGLPSGHYLRLTIKDTGHGMEREVMEKIFNPFFTTKGQGKGTGLGLSVAHSIIKNHGGLISVDSTPGEGTTFQVFLPLLEETGVPEAAKLQLPSHGCNECILFVDDEENLVFAGQRMLERLGYQVVTRSDGLEAFKLFSSQPERFDLVITDQTMPHMTGEVLAKEILNVRADIPIILCSGREVFDDTELCLQRIRAVGIRELVSKPFERTEMSQAIRRALS